jgi:Concanavalin A-like lectin/glucanases superfamily
MKNLMTVAVLVAAAGAAQAQPLLHFRLNETSGNVVDSANGYQTTAVVFGTGMSYGQASVTAGTYGAITITPADAAAFGTSIDFGSDATNAGHFQLDTAGRDAVRALMAPGTAPVFAAGEFTVMAWVNLDSTIPNVQNVFISASQSPPVTRGGWRFSVSEDDIRYTNLGREDLNHTVNMLAGSWYHLASAVKNDTVSYYVNGQFVGSDSFTKTFLDEGASTNALLGGTRDGTTVENMLGRMDDVKVFSTALDESAIAAAALPTSPVPEPAPYAMLLTGLAAVGWMSRQRQR